MVAGSYNSNVLTIPLSLQAHAAVSTKVTRVGCHPVESQGNRRPDLLFSRAANGQNCAQHQRNNKKNTVVKMRVLLERAERWGATAETCLSERHRRAEGREAQRLTAGPPAPPSAPLSHALTAPGTRAKRRGRGSGAGCGSKVPALGWRESKRERERHIERERQTERERERNCN